MAAKKSTAKKTNPKSPKNPVQVIKEAQCKSLEGSATLHYQIGLDDAGEIQLKIDKNAGGGFFSNEWISFTAIQQAFSDWPEDTPINSMALRPLFRGKSVNTPSFMLAVLTAEGLLEPMPKRKRVHRATDPAAFLASLDTQHQGGRVAKSKKSAEKSKASPRYRQRQKQHPGLVPKPPKPLASPLERPARNHSRNDYPPEHPPRICRVVSENPHP